VIFLFAGVLDPGGPAARHIDDLWWLMLVLGTAVFVLFAVVLVLAFRRRNDEVPPGVEVSQSRWWLHGGGVALPAIGVTVVLAATIVVMQGDPETVAADREAASRSSGSEALTVHAVASQFWWEFRYPDHDVVTATELHIPAGDPVQLRIESTDVIHSFWVPELAGKRDALPDNTTFLVIEADEPGTYRGRCAEFCGLGHAHMEVLVVAHGEGEWEEWLAARSRPAAEPTGAESERGQELFLQHCAGCHTVRGTEADGDRGPDLTHFASRQTIGSGVLANNAENLRSWIHRPGEQKEGATMPPADLSDDALAAVAAYLRELE
jgi:cytochrome c oxidase subunit II